MMVIPPEWCPWKLPYHPMSASEGGYGASWTWPRINDTLDSATVHHDFNSHRYSAYYHDIHVTSRINCSTIFPSPSVLSNALHHRYISPTIRLGLNGEDYPPSSVYQLCSEGWRTRSGTCREQFAVGQTSTEILLLWLIRKKLEDERGYTCGKPWTSRTLVKPWYWLTWIAYQIPRRPSHNT